MATRVLPFFVVCWLVAANEKPVQRHVSIAIDPWGETETVEIDKPKLMRAEDAESATFAAEEQDIGIDSNMVKAKPSAAGNQDIDAEDARSATLAAEDHDSGFDPNLTKVKVSAAGREDIAAKGAESATSAAEAQYNGIAAREDVDAEGVWSAASAAEDDNTKDVDAEDDPPQTSNQAEGREEKRQRGKDEGRERGKEEKRKGGKEEKRTRDTEEKLTEEKRKRGNEGTRQRGKEEGRNIGREEKRKRGKEEGLSVDPGLRERSLPKHSPVESKAVAKARGDTGTITSDAVGDRKPCPNLVAVIKRLRELKGLAEESAKAATKEARVAREEKAKAMVQKLNARKEKLKAERATARAEKERKRARLSEQAAKKSARLVRTEKGKALAQARKEKQKGYFATKTAEIEKKKAKLAEQVARKEKVEADSATKTAETETEKAEVATETAKSAEEVAKDELKRIHQLSALVAALACVIVAAGSVKVYTITNAAKEAMELKKQIEADAAAADAKQKMRDLIDNPELRNELHNMHVDMVGQLLTDQTNAAQQTFLRMKARATDQERQTGPWILERRQDMGRQFPERLDCLRQVSRPAKQCFQSDLGAFVGQTNWTREVEVEYLKYASHKARWSRGGFSEIITGIVDRLNGLESVKELQPILGEIAARFDLHGGFRLGVRNQCLAGGPYVAAKIAAVKSMDSAVPKLDKLMDAAQSPWCTDFPKGRYIGDWNRAMIVSSDPFLLLIAFLLLEADPDVEIMRTNNKFFDPELLASHPDWCTHILVNIQVRVKDLTGRAAFLYEVMEVQFIPEDFFVVDGVQHTYYEVTRTDKAQDIFDKPIFK